MKRLACLIVALAAGGTWSGAEERTSRRHDRIRGFPSASIFSLAQDREGFLWTGIEGGGLARFDGREFRPWARRKLTSHILFARGAGEDLVLIVEPVAGAEGGNSLQRIAGDDVEPIEGPDGRPWAGVRDAAYDQTQRLWVARDNQLYYRRDQRAWAQLTSPQLSGDRIRRLAPNRTGGVFVITSHGILSVDGDGAAVRLAQTPLAGDVIDRGDGSVFFVEKRPAGGAIFEVRDGRTREILFRRANFISFALRGRTVWASFDGGVIALRPGEAPEVLGAAQGIPGGGGLVDLEGSLWIGTLSGLVQVTEPEAALWTERDGLPVPAARYLARTSEGVWVATWGGMCRLTWSGSAWHVAAEKVIDHKWPLMTDARGRLWAKERDDFLVRTGGGFTRFHRVDSGVILSTAHASDGTLWIGTDRGLFKTALSDSSPSALALPDGVEWVEQVFEDSRGQLWITAGPRIFHARAAEVASGRRAVWARDDLEGARTFSRVVETSAGTIWAANRPGGVWRYQAGRWTPIPASLNLRTTTVENLIASPSGGIWLLGTGSSVRVVERPESADGWEVVEQITGWHGLPPTSALDLIEESDGTLWLATNAGVVRIRPEARRARPSPPPIKHTAFLVNGQARELGGDARTAYDGDQIELHFAALSYRSPDLLKYQYRLRADGPWVDAKSQDAVFRFLGLRPGRYSAEVRASLDDANWSATPARFDFDVRGPWYLRAWAIAGFLVVIAAMLATAHRARVAVVLRLERQRAAIARDLHDGIGSGLGSIGILAGVVASDAVPEAQRRELVRDIAETAAELGSALTDIVWSLRPESAKLEGLAVRLTQRGGRLFPNGRPAFSTDFPAIWPPADLALSVRHNLLLIATEALHNAARHSKAEHVVLGMAQRGRHWTLWVTDDGCGLGPADRSGLGLTNMRKRAHDIGADIEWSSAGGTGTAVTVVFALA